jgi:hypothetical protein
MATIADKEKGPIILAFLYDQMKNFFKLYIKPNDMNKVEYESAVKEFQKQFSNIDGILNKRIEQNPYEYSQGQITLNIWNKPFSLSGKPFSYFEIDPTTQEYITHTKDGKPFSILDKNNYVLVSETDAESIIQYVKLEDIMKRYDNFVLSSDKNKGGSSLNRYVNFDIGTLNKVFVHKDELIEDDRYVSSDKYIKDKLKVSYPERSWKEWKPKIIGRSSRYTNDEMLDGLNFKLLCDNFEGFSKRKGNNECNKDGAVEDFKFFMDNNISFKDIKFMLEKFKVRFRRKNSFLRLFFCR